jgi:putative membrane protein
MRLILTAAVASLAIATAGCQGSSDNAADANAANDMMMNDGMASDTNASNDMNMANGMAVAPMMASDFVSTVAGSDMYEIASGKLAQTMASNAELKSFGGMLVKDHTKSSTDLKAAASGASPPVTPPAALPAELQAKVDELKAAKGAEFDKLFVQQQKDGHQKTLAALQSYAQGGDQPSLKAFASKAMPIVQGHLDQLDKMKM